MGPIQTGQHGAPVTIPGTEPRAILTTLGLPGRSVVSADTLVELRGGAEPRRTAAKAPRTHIARPRHVFHLRLETADERSQTPTSDALTEHPGLLAGVTSPGPILWRLRELDQLPSAWQSAHADLDAARNRAPWGVP